MQDIFIQPFFDESRAQVSFTTPKNITSPFTWELLSNGCALMQGEQTPASPGRPTCFSIQIDDFIPWHVDTPHLYTLRISPSEEGSAQTIEQPFGMCKLEVTSDSLYLNNQPFYVKGYIRGREAHDHPNFKNLPEAEFYAENIRQAKEHGFNLIRFHSRVPSEECMRAADELGIFIHVEMRKYFGKYQK